MKYRTCGCVRKSPEPRLSWPSTFTSGSSPEYFVQVPRLRPAKLNERALARAGPTFADRTIWNVNSTATGGGVAEMLQSLLAYARGAGVDARWVVIQGDAE